MRHKTGVRSKAGRAIEQSYHDRPAKTGGKYWRADS
jgi:hypothetical protein